MLAIKVSFRKIYENSIHSRKISSSYANILVIIDRKYSDCAQKVINIMNERV